MVKYMVKCKTCRKTFGKTWKVISWCTKHLPVLSNKNPDLMMKSCKFWNLSVETRRCGKSRCFSAQTLALNSDSCRITKPVVWCPCTPWEGNPLPLLRPDAWAAEIDSLLQEHIGRSAGTPWEIAGTRCNLHRIGNVHKKETKGLNEIDEMVPQKGCSSTKNSLSILGPRKASNTRIVGPCRGNAPTSQRPTRHAAILPPESVAKGLIKEL